MAEKRESDLGVKDSPSPTTRCFDAWALPPTWLLFDDGFVVAVSKPVGVSVSAHERGAEHDLTARLRVAREQPTSYLCPHTHLDRDVSGVVLYAAHRDANASLARQSSQGHFEVTYFACVESKGRFPKEGVFSAWMTRDRKGVFRPGKRNPRELKVWYRVADSSTRRHLLEVRCSQGARGIRAVLANAGAAIAGDRTYGGSPAPRLMLHAAQISMMDPRSGRHVPINAPLPWAFAPWLRGQVDVADIDAHCLKAAFLEAAASRYALVANGKVEAIRLVHGEAEALRGLDIEWFGSYAVVWLTENTEECVQKRVVDSLQVLRPHGVYLKIRPKQASRIVHARFFLTSEATENGYGNVQMAVVCSISLPILVRFQSPQRRVVRAPRRALTSRDALWALENETWRSTNCTGNLTSLSAMTSSLGSTALAERVSFSMLWSLTHPHSAPLTEVVSPRAKTTST